MNHPIFWLKEKLASWEERALECRAQLKEKEYQHPKHWVALKEAFPNKRQREKYKRDKFKEENKEAWEDLIYALEQITQIEEALMILEDL